MFLRSRIMKGFIGMGLLHKNLILASIASAVMVGLLGSSSASALDGFSFSDIINQQQTQSEQLLPYLTNPFSAGAGCESANPDSTISCNETPFPNLLFNGAPNNTTWGYDGKGLIFVDNDNLIDNNPQLATAKRGDTLNYSMEIKTQRYNDEAATNPVRTYEVYALFSDGLMLDKDSIKITIDGKALEQGTYTFDVAELEGGDGLSTVFDGAKSVFGYQLTWMNQNETFIYDEDAIIAITYSARVTEDAPSEVYSRGAYASLINQDHSIFQSTEHQATALLDGNILIRRIDANGSPLAGARYTIDGVKATATAEADNVFVYDDNGDISTFETGTDGYIVITNVPFGTYTVREVQAPQGHETQVEVLTRSNTDNLIDASYGEETFMLSLPGADMSADVTECIENLQNGKRGLDYPCVISKFGTSPAALETVATWNEEEQAYTNDDGLRITKEGNSFIMDDRLVIPYSPDTGTYNATVTFSEAMKMDGGSDEDLIFNINDNGTATFLYGETTLHYTLNNTTGCYDLVDDVSFGLSFCKDGDNYISKAYESYDHYLIVVPTDQPGVYKMDYDHMYLTIDVLDDDTVKLGYYFAVMYSEYLNKYLVSLQSTLIGAVPLENSQGHVMAAEYLFQDKTSDATPEGISNPQTSDAIIKTIIIAVAGLAPIFILRKQLTKRAN